MRSDSSRCALRPARVSPSWTGAMACTRNPGLPVGKILRASWPVLRTNCVAENAHRLSHRSRFKLLWAPGRSPDSRILEPELPSRSWLEPESRLSTPVASIAPALRAYSGVGRAGFSPASQINQTMQCIAQVVIGSQGQLLPAYPGCTNGCLGNTWIAGRGRMWIRSETAASMKRLKGGYT